MQVVPSQSLSDTTAPLPSSYERGSSPTSAKATHLRPHRDVSLCHSQPAPEVEGDCPFNGSLDKGKSAYLTSDTVGGSVHFEIRRYGGGTVEFRAINPTTGEPYFKLWDNAVVIQVQTHDLCEGCTVQAQVGGMPVQVERRGDTDVKVMRLIAK